MKAWVRRSRLRFQPARCRGCDKQIVLVADVGWVLDVHGANSYDICEGDLFGNHAPYDRAGTTADAALAEAGAGGRR